MQLKVCQCSIRHLLFYQEDVRRNAGGSEADYLVLSIDYILADIYLRLFGKNTGCCQFKIYVIALIAWIIQDISARVIVVSKRCKTEDCPLPSLHLTRD
jgi:hypothetical protein